MSKAKTHKSTSKRFKITAGGKFLKLHARTGHLKVKQSSRTKRRKAGEELLSQSFLKKVKHLLPGR